MSDTLHLLVADDDPTVRLLAAAALDGRGFMVHAVADGHAALAALRQDNFALALLDVDMPGLDGYLVCAAIRREQATLPVVLVTGHDDREAIAAAYEAGASDFLAKPVDWSKLAERLREILANQDKRSG